MFYSPFHPVGTLFSCRSHFNGQVLHSTAVDFTYFRLKVLYSEKHG